DADELVSPRLVKAFLATDAVCLGPGTTIDCRFYHLWGSADRYRDDESLYQPHWKSIGVIDDRRIDYDRSVTLPLHEPRIPPGAGMGIPAESVPVFHLQWLLPRRNQIKQAWYRCRELMDGRKPAAEINQRYAIALP